MGTTDPDHYDSSIPRVRARLKALAPADLCVVELVSSRARGATLKVTSRPGGMNCRRLHPPDAGYVEGPRECRSPIGSIVSSRTRGLR
jgi:hypothetical protein